MKIAFFSSKSYDKQHFDAANVALGWALTFFDGRLEAKTCKLAHGFTAVCLFVNDCADRAVLTELAAHGTRLIALRCAGYNNVDLVAAKELGLTVVRVPAYSPEATAEHAIGMMLCLNRRIHKAYQRTRDANFSLEGLVGFNMHGKTVGVVGTGKIGLAALRILHGFGMRLLAHDPYPNPTAQALGVSYVPLGELLAQSDIISLHCPLFKENYHLIDATALKQMKDGVMIINTSRGGLLDANAAIEGLKSGRIGALGLDVYEDEEDLFFSDKSNEVIADDVFRRLSACHNVLFTGHQAFLTKEALAAIAQTTLENVRLCLAGAPCANQVQA
ncbi:MAG: 2-hydroxyacid dehydrogenase [Aeromonas sp.]